MKKNVKIVIIGAGFGGIELAKALRNQPVDVLLIDQHNYHNFQPLMYQVATGGLEAGSIAYPVRRIFRNYKNVSFRMTEVSRVDLVQNQLETSVGKIPYDYLVIATGSENNFFNFEPIKDQLLTLKSIPDALNMRSFIIQNLERAMVDNSKEPLEEIMNIAIVGGGPAGIELAGALSEMKKYVLPKDFPGLDFSKMSINLYEASPKVLAVMSEKASTKSLQYLKELGINVYLNAKVASYDGSAITLTDGTTLLTDTVIWTAGVKGSPIEGLPKESIIRGNRISINEFNQVFQTKNIFAIGDVAAHTSQENPKGLPMLAPVAQQQGKQLAKNILNLINQKPLKPFIYRNKGVMATVGRKKAVVDLPNFKFQGTFAWLVWMLIHIMSLVGFRNKVVTFVDWLSNYFSFDRPLGLIIRPYKRPEIK
ncbi:NADH dehydrogenase-like protein [Arenibacter sp. NBRC 103722]|uniref:NAD(P)/FAD-dependent oxidoreductase n=1 Tax=Arenibacter sp. NBRC 103722 TaxID=1113929 RepID=UPI000852B4E4|nr:NAD(P)/FAD-dependent oxidoreductase [Arenibacter sp. NBRC 103722]MDX1766439.1 NAD(P)/FAD-dependent oxidoreductase [Arenibacter troitsensis]GBF21596.1 NADH dehydrogenase-like protein [Arenibacter sp. NBRC 103722]|tara:strand:+ start:571 stop:1839 length:1269 start_codon:yes stop_codon:yes gene_type:complete